MRGFDLLPVSRYYVLMVLFTHSPKDDARSTILTDIVQVREELSINATNWSHSYQSNDRINLAFKYTCRVPIFVRLWCSPDFPVLLILEATNLLSLYKLVSTIFSDSTVSSSTFWCVKKPACVTDV